MYLVIVFLTLISSLSVGFYGRFFGFYGSALLATSCLILAFLVSIFIFYEVAFVGCFSYIKLISWMISETLNVDWGFMFDSLSSVMCCVVTFYDKKVNSVSKTKLTNFLLTAPLEKSGYIFTDLQFLCLIFGVCFIMISILLPKEKKNLSFYFSFAGLLFIHDVLLHSNLVEPLFLGHLYLLFNFLIYHCYFTFTKKFFLNIKVIIEVYLKSSNYVKLVLWIFIFFSLFVL